ncbi:MAG: aspartate kinase [Planctomycetes bacterium]|nr:aspartate kinase [Planctomycetota bacterium]
MRHGIVQKFGGTSVGSADAIRRVGQIVAGARERAPFVVVSAAGGVTNRLIALGEAALAGGDVAEHEREIVALHRRILADLGLPEDLGDPWLAELDGLARGIALLKERSPRTADRLASLGERLSARIVAAHLASLGLPAYALDAWDAGLETDARFGCARPLPSTRERIRAAAAAREGLPVVTGFLGREPNGAVTTLGRGGSDYSAAIFGAALGVAEIQIWTDVDGVMTADPRQVPAARPVPVLSFAEAAELAFFGAKVLHPATMAPAVKAGIPIRVLNTWRPAEPGTRVVSSLAPDERRVKSIATKGHIAAVNVVASEMMFQYGFLERIADAFARHEVVVDVIATSEVSVALTVDAAADLRPVVADLAAFSEVSVVRDLALVSVVGEELRDGLGIQAQIFATLAELGVRAEMASYGATRNNLSIVVARERARDVVDALHERLFGAGAAPARRS